ncbi:ZIP family metal transporter [Candidatus Peregrinibacteria bacterium]|nr:ZIP family metal transporter [Candidatus Peregrinibacteria bacterium]
MVEVPGEVWLYALGSVLLVSLIAFAGIFTLSMKKESLQKIVMYLVSFAAGALLGDAFLHMLPEVAHEYGFDMQISMSVLIGILIFFVTERFIHYHHCHNVDHPHIHSFAIMNLIGDGVHNLIDGMVIAASYMVSIEVGIATTLAVVFHEIPQEMGDFGVLLHGGFSRGKALLLNFGSALLAVAGAVITLLLASHIEGVEKYLVPIAAGGFIYIACTDLIPELHKENSRSKLIGQFIVFLIGIGVMWLLLEFGHGH